MNLFSVSSPHRDLQGFLLSLEKRGQLKRIASPVSLVHEMTEIHRRVLEAGGPALLFENPVGATGQQLAIPVVTNVFGTRERICWAFGSEQCDLGALSELLAELRQPRPPVSFGDMWSKASLALAALSMRTTQTKRPACQQTIWLDPQIDLGKIPVQWCWPGEPAPLVTWPLVITSAPDDPFDINVGVYRMQVLAKDKLIVRWLAHRGGARHHRMWKALGRDMPIAVVLGADPATMLSAVMPLPEQMSELSFAGLLRGAPTRVAHAATQPLPVPANAEIVLEGTVKQAETAPEGPYGDHTGYYNSVEEFPVVSLSAITMRRDPVYISTYTGRPPDEPSLLGEVLNELFVPLVKRQFPEILDLWLPPEACSYRAMVVSIDKRYPGQARRVMMGLWSILPQFTYTKLIIAVDGDINVRSWPEVVWALSTRFDAGRDVMVVRDTPIDYLDFASPKTGLGSKMGLDATTKIGTETDREWGAVLRMNDAVRARVDAIWDDLGLQH